MYYSNVQVFKNASPLLCEFISVLMCKCASMLLLLSMYGIVQCASRQVCVQIQYVCMYATVKAC